MSPDIETATQAYAQRFSGAIGEWMLEAQEKAILRMLEGCLGAHVLDVGGAHGQLVGPLVYSGHRISVFGSKGTPTARIQSFLDSGLCALVTGDLLKLPFLDQSFDSVVAIRLLAHIRSWESFIAELCRVAKRSVIVDFSSPRSWNVLYPLFFGVKLCLEGNTRPYTLFRDDEVLSAFQRNGFELGIRSPLFALPMVAHRVLRTPVLSRGAEGLLNGVGITKWIGSPIVLQAVRRGVRG